MRQHRPSQLRPSPSQGLHPMDILQNPEMRPHSMTTNCRGHHPFSSLDPLAPLFSVFRLFEPWLFSFPSFTVFTIFVYNLDGKWHEEKAKVKDSNPRIQGTTFNVPWTWMPS